MEMKAGLTFACMNLKKLARILARKEKGGLPFQDPPHILKKIYLKIRERCWSLTPAPLFVYSLKPYNSYNSSGNLQGQYVTKDDLFIPSNQEVYKGTLSNGEGAVYPLYNDASDLSGREFYLRTHSSSSNYWYTAGVNLTGGVYTSAHSSSDLQKNMAY